LQYVIVRPESDNELGFDSRTEALAALRRSLAVHGPEVVGRWHLVRAPRRGEWTLVATGDVLLALFRPLAPRAA
jgi:hypothetical protein